MNCPNCHQPQTLLYLEGQVIGHYCDPCSQKINGQKLLEAALLALDALQESRTEAGKAAFFKLRAALQNR